MLSLTSLSIRDIFKRSNYLHEDVVVGFRVRLVVVYHKQSFLLQKLYIQVLLRLSQSHIDIDFNFVRQFSGEVIFCSSEHEGSHYFVELLYCFHVLFLLLLLVGEVKPLIEVVFGLEHIRHEEVK